MQINLFSLFHKKTIKQKVFPTPKATINSLKKKKINK